MAAKVRYYTVLRPALLMRDGCLRCGRGTCPSWPVIIGLTIRLAVVGNAPRLKPGFRWNIRSIRGVRREHTGLSHPSCNAMSLGLGWPLVSARDHLIPRIPNLSVQFPVWPLEYYRTLLVRLSQKLSLLLWGSGLDWWKFWSVWVCITVIISITASRVRTISPALQPSGQCYITSNM